MFHSSLEKSTWETEGALVGILLMLVGDIYLIHYNVIHPW
jgi:hypothetical protein